MMKQQYQVLRKENDWFYDYVGKELSKSILNQAADRLYKEHGKFGFPGFAKGIVAVTDEHKRILAIGGSSLLKERKTGKIIPDLTNRNFGRMLNELLGRAIGNGQRTATLFETTGGSAAYDIQQPAAFTNGAFIRKNATPALSGKGAAMQVGSGTTAPTTSDNSIETAFGTAPEDGVIQSIGAFAEPTARIISSNGIVAGGAGTVNESVFMARWFPQGGDSNLIVLFRDAISPGVPFIATNTITSTYSLQM